VYAIARTETLGSLAAGSWAGSQYERNANERARTPRICKRKNGCYCSSG
jgi:hypothetical protein